MGIGISLVTSSTGRVLGHESCEGRVEVDADGRGMQVCRGGFSALPLQGRQLSLGWEGPFSRFPSQL